MYKIASIIFAIFLVTTVAGVVLIIRDFQIFENEVDLLEKEKGLELVKPEKE